MALQLEYKGGSYYISEEELTDSTISEMSAYLDEDLRILLVMPGYRSSSEMLPIVSYVGSNKYKDMKWEAYINETKGEK